MSTMHLGLGDLSCTAAYDVTSQVSILTVWETSNPRQPQLAIGCQSGTYPGILATTVRRS
jgi:hypothetical protein